MTFPDLSLRSDSRASTLVELLRCRALRTPQRRAFTCLVEGEAEAIEVTYAELERRARAVGALLQSRRATGERVLLLFPPGLDYIAGFFGCLYAGAIAVPAYPPRLNRNIHRLQAIAADAQAAFALTSKVSLRPEALLERFPEFENLEWLATDDLASGLEEEWRDVAINADALAYLQYTSGSTATPKGVMVSHANVLHNSEFINRGFGHTHDSVSLTWLPPYHDMGLVEGIIQPIYGGFHAFVMPPVSFLQRPLRWLQAISRFAVSHTGGPNFAYDLCLRKVTPEQRAALDLSSWTVAYSGAEPVRRETIEQFTAAFAPSGFRRRAFYPGYGLAEATLKVAGGEKGDAPVYLYVDASTLAQNRVELCESAPNEAACALVGSGHADDDTQIVIADPETSTRCPPQEVGEIWVSGPSVAQGYWNRPDETETTFRAYLADTGGGPFLRTGDLGFLKDGELFVTGRLKDLIIIRGRNHYPQDFELTMERSHAALKPHSGAAFSVDINGEERLVLVQEIETRRHPNTGAIIENIRQSIAEVHEVQPVAVLLIRPGDVPKTSSGKVQRHKCRERFLSGDFSVVAEWRADDECENEALVSSSPTPLRSRNEIESWLRSQVAAKLRLNSSAIDADQPITRYGLDSLLAVELAHTFEVGLGLTLPMATLLQGATIADLATRAYQELKGPPTAEVVAAALTDDNSVAHPLSHGQQALWFLHQMAPESPAYNIAGALRIRSRLDADALRDAFQILVDRHACLRTTFAAQQGEPFQVIREGAKVSFRVEDASEWNETVFNERLSHEARRPFDLQQAPPLRLTLFTLPQDQHLLLLVAHHIVTDFWSLEVLLDELRVLYPAARRGVDATLPPLRLQYADYVRWQSEMLAGPRGSQLWEYWQAQLGDELPALNLLADRPRPRAQTFRGASESFSLAPELAQNLKALAQTHNATLYTTLLAAFQVLLHRYSGQRVILVGSPTAGRARAGFSDLVGYFVNPVVLRADLSANPDFGTFLDQVRQTVLAAFEHQDYPFALLVDRLQPERDPGRSPLFQVMFVLQKAHRLHDEGLSTFALNEAGARLTLGELDLESVALQQRIAQFDLTLTMAEVDNGLRGSFEYNSDLFEGITIQRMSRHFITLLESIVADAEQRVAALNMLSDSERHQLVVAWNDTAKAYPGELCMHQLVEQQAERAPGAVALVYGEEQWSYAQFNRRANQVARYLRRLGVGPETHVAIVMERSPEMLVALLGILKAGGAYVPVDPAYPQERLSFMLKDAAVAAVLTQRRLVEKLPVHEARLVCLDADWKRIAAESEENPAINCTAENQAYVIYTSGSTGVPKGVVVSHGALVSRVLGMGELYGTNPGDRSLQFFSLSFDAAAEEIFTTLVSGGSLVVHPHPAQIPPGEFLAECGRLGVTIQQLAPAYWHQVVDEMSAAGRSVPPSLRLLVTGGESPSAKRLKQWAQMAGARSRFINTYGPTEATITATSYVAPLEEEVLARLATVPIGQPVFNTTAYILDEQLEPVPVGVPGELYLGGTGLARGYLGHPETTARAFIPNPFGESGSRLYRTGDLARYLADGQIEFLGRKDHQVKIRGFRIELGEIEAALRTYPGVGETVVVVREDTPGDKRLVAYIAGTEDRKRTAGELRRHLKEGLPEYMVPSMFVLLDKLPRTVGGKLDRRRLPLPEQTRPELEQAFVPPRNEVEETLVRIWSEVLGVDRIGIDDNFFELGGDSILSLQIIARANEAGLQLKPNQLFQHQTVAQLAAVPTKAQAIRGEQGAVSGPVPFTPIQHWFFEQNFSDPHYWNQAVLLATEKRLDASVLQKVVRQLLAHHDALRLRFVRGNVSWQQFNAAVELNEIFSVIDLSRLHASEHVAAMSVAAAELQSTLNLSDGPLVRVALFDLGAAQPNHVAVIVHHLAIDGVSWRILLEDLQVGYGQLERGEQIEFAPKTTSYKRWAERLTEHARSLDANQEITYWLAQSGAEKARLPVDYSSGAHTEGSARTVSAYLSVEQTAALLRDAPAAYHTQINEILLTALAQSFAGWTGAGSMLVEIEGHGREDIAGDIDLSRTVGWFTTSFPVLLQLATGCDIGQALNATKERLRQVPHRGIGYGLLRYLSEDSQISAQLRSLPQPEVSFNYLGQLDQTFPRDFKLSAQSAGPTRSARAKRSHLLELEAKIIEGHLRLDWRYSETVHRRVTIENLARDYVEKLRSLILHCQSTEPCSYTPSDFPLAKLDQQTLDKIIGANTRIEDIYPLSPMQQGMLFHSLYAPDSGAYVEQLSFVLRRRLNVSAFKRAWQHVVDRHSVLRTSFVWEGADTPLQVVHRTVTLPWQEEDWRGLSPIEQEQRLESFRRHRLVQGFDLSSAPLMHVALIRIADDAYQLAWSHHHLLLDGWCLSLILKEVFAFYSAFCRGEHLQLKRSRPYRDYIAWLQRQDLAAAEKFWRGKLKGFRAPTPLLPGRAGRSVSRDDNLDGEQQLTLSRETTLQLQSLARHHQLTLSTLLHGAWALLVSQYTGEEEVVFGATVAGRPESLPGVEQMVGLFINTLPVRVKAFSSEFLLPWLRELQAQQSEARQYEYSPLVEIQRWSEIPPGQPLFETIVAFENYPLDAQALGRENLDATSVRSFERTNYPLAVMVRPGAELAVKVLFDPSRFDDGSIARVLAHLRTLLHAMISNPAGRLGDLSLLSDAECHHALIEWNQSEASYPRELCINELFEAQAERTPKKVAVVFGSEQLTYAELNRRANQVAHYLRALGVGPEVHVGICMERSTQMIVGLLAILKAGGVYVPLDPTYPKHRLAFMLNDSHARVLITQARVRADLPEHTAHIVSLDSDWNIVSRQRTDNPSNLTGPENLAYVTYTSGSTGKPKGVAVPHHAVNRLVFNTNYVVLSASDNVAQIANASFDAATFEIWGALLRGAQLVGITADVALSPADFASQLKEHEISVLFLTTALFNQVASEAPSAFTTVKTVLFGGEAVDPVSVGTVLRQGGPDRLLHVYGPTESTTFSTWHLIDQVEDGATTIPIGHPITNTTVYLLDKDMRPVPVGVPGELYIGGEGLARGYLHQPQLTAERFIPHPFSGKPGARLYRTGDIARYLPDGEIEFIGRMDHQVKVRGFRIELEEIEAAIAEHAAVRETVVVARGESGKEKRLVAYLVLRDGQSLRPGELRRFLKHKLPEYMVPFAFVTLESLPLTPNGKIDRRALPAPDRARPQTEDPFVPPRSGVEDVLTEIWSTVLDLEEVGVHDNFFELGGHSLTATQVISRVRQAFRIDLPLRALFEAPTVASLALRIEAACRADQGLELQPIAPRSRDGDLSLSFAQQRLWFLHQLAPDSTAYHISGSVSLKGPLHVPALEQSMNEIVARHESLRTTFVQAERGPVQVIAPAFGLSVTKVDLTGLAENERKPEALRLAHQAAERPFDLTRLPLLRLTLLRLEEEEHVLAMTMHHIISDGWSIRVFVREMMALYEACYRNETSPLPELQIQYADFAAWQRQWLRGETLQTQLRYWKQQLGGSPAMLELPLDRPRPVIQSSRGASYSFALPKALRARLKTLSRQEGVTLFMTLLAAFKTLLHRYTQVTDILVGTPIANRNRPEIEELIGFFVNTLVLRTDLSGNPTFRRLLRRVREVALGAYAHQDLPFEKLVEELRPERDISHSPLFQVMFVLQDALLPPLEVGGLKLTRMADVPTESSVFDLTLALEETEDGLAGSLDYNTDLFEAATIARMARHYQTLLESIVEESDQRVSDLQLLSANERSELLVEWNNTEGEFAKPCVHHVFEAQVARAPESVAVMFEDEWVSYAELNRRANQLAHYLQRIGVGPEVRVGVLVERSVEMIVAVLGILKAGGAYVPLDPAYPAKRLDFMIGDSDIHILVAQEALTGRLPQHGARMVCIDTEWNVIAAESYANPTSLVRPNNLAYIIYTSGSTGRPKGVALEHQGLSNLIDAQGRIFGVGPHSRVLQFASLSFDASVSEIFVALSAGAALSLGSTHSMLPGPELTRLVRNHAVTTVTLPPLMLKMLRDEDLPGVRTIVAAGDACPAEVLARWCRDRVFLNAYGPTEATVCATVANCLGTEGQPPIGRPIANTQVYILDEQLRPVPVRIAGELHIGGVGLARGYINQPGLTAEKFIPHPFSKQPGARLYKTGDLARYRADGQIEFLGRLDHQLKLRGTRIELGEIEAVLGEQEGVREAIVVPRTEANGDPRLVAYILAGRDRVPSNSELRGFLKERLPANMIPSAFVFLDVFPMTVSGKVDRQALPAPEGLRAELATPYAAPQTELERTIAAIWQKALRLDKVGINDNFFDLGGHSLLVVDVHRRLQERLGIDLTLIELFRYPTVISLAHHLAGGRDSRAATAKSHLRAKARRESISRLRKKRDAVKCRT